MVVLSNITISENYFQRYVIIQILNEAFLIHCVLRSFLGCSKIKVFKYDSVKINNSKQITQIIFNTLFPNNFKLNKVNIKSLISKSGYEFRRYNFISKAVCSLRKWLKNKLVINLLNHIII